MYLKTNSHITYVIKTVGVMILFAVGAFLAYHTFAAIQNKVHNAQQFMIFIRGKHLELTFFIITAAMMLLYISSQDSLGYIKIIKYIKAQIIWVLLIIASIAALYIQLYSFTGVGEMGVIHQGSVFDKQIIYSWENIEKVSVFTLYEKGRMPQTPVIHYHILSKNQQAGFNLCESEDFWKAILIVDDFVVKNKIPVQREKIDSHTLLQILTGYEYNCRHEQAENVLNRIFVVE